MKPTNPHTRVRSYPLRLSLLAFACLASPAPAQNAPSGNIPTANAAAQSAPAIAPVAPSSPAPTTLPSVTPGKRKTKAAADAYLAGARLLDRKDLAGAEAEFSRALQLNPTSHDYQMAVALTHEHRITELVQQAGKARILGQNAKAESYLAQARLLDPTNAIVAQHSDPGALPVAFLPQIASGPAPLAGAIALHPNASSQTFHLKANLQEVLRQVATSYGLRAVVDSSVPSVPIHFDLDHVAYTQAMPILLQMGGLFSVPLDSASVLIAKDTPENRLRLEPLLEETIYVPGSTNEQMTELTNIVKNIFDLKQVTAQNSLGTLVVRAPESILNAVNLTLADLIDGGSQIVIDLKLYAIDKTNTRNIGAQLPQQIGIYNVESEATNLVNANQSLVNQAIAQGLVPANASNIVIALALIASGLAQSTLLSNTVGFFGGGLTATGVTTNASPTFNLALNSSDTRALDDIQIRVGDRQTGVFRIGSRYPITTSTYTTSASSLSSSALAGVNINGVSAASLLANLSSATIPQIQYEDLGISLKATPTVQKSGAITMHLELKIEALAGSALNAIPVLASRQFASDVTVNDGQTALLLSSASKSEAGAISGLPGLAELPGFQDTASNDTVTTSSTELVMLVTPHVVRRRSNIYAGPRIALNLPLSTD